MNSVFYILKNWYVSLLVIIASGCAQNNNMSRNDRQYTDERSLSLVNRYLKSVIKPDLLGENESINYIILLSNVGNPTEEYFGVSENSIVDMLAACQVYVHNDNGNYRVHNSREESDIKGVDAKYYPILKSSNLSTFEGTNVSVDELIEYANQRLLISKSEFKLKLQKFNHSDRFYIRSKSSSVYDLLKCLGSESGAQFVVSTEMNPRANQ